MHSYDSLASAQESVFGPVGRWLIRTEERLSEAFFGGSFAPHPVRVSLVAPYGHWMGLAGNSASVDFWSQHSEAEHPLDSGIWLALHRGWFQEIEEQVDDSGRPRRRALRSPRVIMAEQILLHEMVHVALRRAGRQASHDSPDWGQEVERIYRLLGYDCVVGRPANLRYAALDEDGLFTHGPLRGWVRYPGDGRVSLSWNASLHFPHALLGGVSPLERVGVPMEPPPEWALQEPFQPWGQRDLAVRDCAQCGVAFAPKRDDARYCSSRCRVIASRNRTKSASLGA